MAIVISSSDPVQNSTNTQVSNDTNWMQDLVIETKTEKKEETTQKESASNNIIEKINTEKVVQQETIPNNVSAIHEDTKQAESAVIADKKDPMITNMYIAADKKTTEKTNSKPVVDGDTVTNNEREKTNPKTVNLDDLFGNTAIAVQEQKPQIVETNDKKSSTNREEKDHKTIQKFMFGLAGILVIIAGGFFIIKTVFPLSFQNTEEVTNTGNIVAEATNNTETESTTEHTAAPVPTKTLAEVYAEKLIAYASSGEYYHNLGRDAKNRNLIRYGLFIHKKSLDLQDDIQKAIVLSGQIDTVSIEAYLAQFDDYIGILEETVANDPDIQATLNTLTGASSQTENNTDFAPQASQTETGETTTGNTGSQQTLDQFLNQVSQSQ